MDRKFENGDGLSDVVLRSLNDGWEYHPEWRNLIIQQYMGQLGGKDDLPAVQQVMYTEKDPYIRQALRFRLGLKCVNREAFEYAYRTQFTKMKSGCASMIRSMAIADLRAEEIAEQLHTRRSNIVAFLRLFYDVEPYLSCDAWLQSIVFPADECLLTTAEAIREYRWLATAYADGWDGLQKVLFHRTPATKEEITRLRLKIHAALGSRAAEFAMTQQMSGKPASGKDLKRFLLLEESISRQPPEPDRAAAAVQWIRALHGGMTESAQTSDATALSVFKGLGKGDANQAGAVAQLPRYRRANSGNS